MKRLTKFILSVIVVSTGLQLLGMLGSRLFGKGTDEDSEDFRVGVFWGGRQFTSRSRSLCSGSALAVLGGIDLDLTDAIPHPAGIDLSLRTYGGGMKVVIPSGWRVQVEEDVASGQLDLRTTDPADLPEDAPLVDIEVVIRAGGMVIEHPG
jgi:hypothetical protein